MEWLRRNAPTVLLGVALAAAGTLTMALGSGTTFFQDTWGFLLDRQDFDARAFLMPHNEHISVFPVALQKLELALFGMTSATPERVALTVALLVSATLLFVYVRRRIGPWPALIAAVLLLFLGAAWPDLLWGFQIAFVGSAIFGIAMLLALDRGDRRGDVAATAFLTLSLGFSSLGLSFLVGAAADVLQRRRSHGLARTYLVAIPAALYAAWWLGWGHEAESRVTLDNVLNSPAYALEGVASAVESLLGLNQSGPDMSVAPVWGVPILVALIALIGYRQWRQPGFSPRLWPVAAAAAANWLLAGFNFIPGREAYQSRYLYAGGIFVLLLAAELLRGVRIGRRALRVAAAVTVLAVAANLVALSDGSKWLEEQAVLTRADTAAIEISRRTVDPSFGLIPEIAGTGSLFVVVADKYLRAVDEWGSPAYTAEELAAAPAAGRRQADVVLSRALPITVTELPAGESAPGDECTAVAAGSGLAELPLTPGETGIEVAPGPPATLGLRRFADGEYPVELESVPGGSSTVIEIPRDTAPQPWYLQVEAAQDVRVCG